MTALNVAIAELEAALGLEEAVTNISGEADTIGAVLIELIYL
jgi:hypothetical protein